MKSSLKPLSIEGFSYAHWILMDYGEVIVHVFRDETRDYYDLEKLWLDAPRIPVEGEDTPPGSERYYS
jgi:ribosome-associated protein